MCSIGTMLVYSWPGEKKKNSEKHVFSGNMEVFPLSSRNDEQSQWEYCLCSTSQANRAAKHHKTPSLHAPCLSIDLITFGPSLISLYIKYLFLATIPCHSHPPAPGQSNCWQLICALISSFRINGNNIP